MAEDGLILIDRPNRKRGVIATFLVGGVLILGLGFVAQKLRNQPPVKNLPTVHFVSILDSVTNPVAVRFVTVGRPKLRFGAGGWLANSLHPHLLVDDVVSMPNGDDIEQVMADTFAITLPQLLPGPHRVVLFWANDSHAAIGDSAATNLFVSH